MKYLLYYPKQHGYVLNDNPSYPIFGMKHVAKIFNEKEADEFKTEFEKVFYNRIKKVQLI